MSNPPHTFPYTLAHERNRLRSRGCDLGLQNGNAGIHLRFGEHTCIFSGPLDDIRVSNAVQFWKFVGVAGWVSDTGYPRGMEEFPEEI